MKPVLTNFCCLLGISTLVAQGPATSSFTVHEWGTFTSVSGSDGLTLLGAHHEEEALPDFVHGYDRIHKSGYSVKGCPVPLQGVTQKMETPVIYFHAGAPLRVKVAVEFKDGLTSQWYPEVEELVPAAITKGPPGFDLAEIQCSRVAWDVEVVPGATALTERFPKVDSKQPWSFAREVDAASVRVAGSRGKGEAEKYLFYRGLGRFQLPVRVAATKGGVVEFVNAGREAVPGLIVLEVGAAGGRYRLLPQVAGAASNACDLGAIPLRPVAQVVSELQQVVVEKLLLPQGLYADESRAMVRTWARSWFGKVGTRVLYVVPRAEVDRILPITITPTPTQLVRVLLGRIEFLTPELETDLESALAATSRSGSAGEALLHSVRSRLDRFFEPALRRVAASTKDGAVAGAAKKLLREFE